MSLLLNVSLMKKENSCVLMDINKPLQGSIKEVASVCLWLDKYIIRYKDKEEGKEGKEEPNKDDEEKMEEN